MIEKDLPQPPPQPPRARKEESVVNAGRRIFILNVNSPDLPMVYWFDTAPAAADANYLPYVIGNFALFGFPDGRIYQSEKNQFLMGGYKVNTETYSFAEFHPFLQLSAPELQ